MVVVYHYDFLRICPSVVMKMQITAGAAASRSKTNLIPGTSHQGMRTPSSGSSSNDTWAAVICDNVGQSVRLLCCHAANDYDTAAQQRQQPQQ